MYTYMNELLLPTTLLQQNTVKQDINLNCMQHTVKFCLKNWLDYYWDFCHKFSILKKRF